MLRWSLCNNQYGDAMSQYLPTGGFERMKFDTISSEFWSEFALNQNDKQEHEELHDHHDNFPLAPEGVADRKGQQNIQV